VNATHIDVDTADAMMADTRLWKRGMAVALSDMQENYWVQRRSMAACIRHGDHKNRNAALKGTRNITT